MSSLKIKMHKSADVSTKSPRQPRPQNMDLDKDKVHRKVKRKQAQYLKQEPKTDIGFQEEPSVHLFIGNGGLKNGVPREVLEHMLNPLQSEGYLKQLYLPSGKDYAFVTFTSTIIASQCLVSLNGVCIVEVCRSNESLLQSLPPALLHGPPVHLYMSYVNKIPSSILGCGMPKRTECSQLPPGLILLEDFVSIQEEDQLLKFFSFESETKQTLQPNRTTHGIVSANDEPQQTAIVVKRTEGGCSPPKATLKHRQVMHFGYEFLYGSNLVDPNNPLPGRLPAITHPLLDRMMEQGLITHHPDQLTVNRYNPGAGIHVPYGRKFSWGKICVVFVVDGLTTNIYPRMNQPCLPLPAVQAATTKILSTK